MTVLEFYPRRVVRANSIIHHVFLVGSALALMLVVSVSQMWKDAHENARRKLPEIAISTPQLVQRRSAIVLRILALCVRNIRKQALPFFKYDCCSKTYGLSPIFIFLFFSNELDCGTCCLTPSLCTGLFCSHILCNGNTVFPPGGNFDRTCHAKVRDWCPAFYIYDVIVFDDEIQLFWDYTFTRIEDLILINLTEFIISVLT